MGASNILVEADPDFQAKLSSLTEKLQVTSVFEGVGGEMINRIAQSLPMKSVISSYGQLSGPGQVGIPLNLLMSKDLTVKSFSNFRSETVRDPKQMKEALQKISELLILPSFNSGDRKYFGFKDIEAALAFTGTGQGKAFLKFEE